MNRLSVLENVLMARSAARHSGEPVLATSPASKTARVTGADPRWHGALCPSTVSTLSGGQQQRVAIARALMHRRMSFSLTNPSPRWTRNRHDRDGHPARHQPERRHYRGRHLHQVDYALRYCERIVALRQGTSSTTAAANSLITNVLTISTQH